MNDEIKALLARISTEHDSMCGCRQGESRCRRALVFEQELRRLVHPVPVHTTRKPGAVPMAITGTGAIHLGRAPVRESVPRVKKRGAKPNPELEKARPGLRTILLEKKFAEADTATIVSEANKRGVFCPYGLNWDIALVKRYNTVFSLISRERDYLHNLHNCAS